MLYIDDMPRGKILLHSRTQNVFYMSLQILNTLKPIITNSDKIYINTPSLSLQCRHRWRLRIYVAMHQLMTLNEDTLGGFSQYLPMPLTMLLHAQHLGCNFFSGSLTCITFST
jgi:hypothetical protein